MTGDAQPPATDALVAEVAALRDLFLRRLMEDRGKQELYERLYQELAFARSDLTGQFIAPICREVLLLLDLIGAAATAATDPREILDAVVVELEELLARRNVTPVDAVGAAFDPAVHEAVDQVAVADPAGDGRIVGQRRSGYRMDSRLLRPAQVVVGRYAAAPPGDG